MNDLFLIILFLWNSIVFLIMGIDKYKAKHHRYRISETTLLLCSFCFGSIGGLLGMVCFHHKIRKRKFQLCMPLAFILQLSIYLLVID